MTHDPRDVECAREAYQTVHGPTAMDPPRSSILAAKLARERAESGGVDPKVLRAREFIAVEYERINAPAAAKEYRNGRRDSEPEIRAVLAALSEGERG